MKDIRGIRGTHYIASLIAEGEHECQDFKFAIPDARKIARSLSAFANHSGGRLLIGVKDNGVVAGVRSEEEIYMIEQAAEMHCVPAQKVNITPFRVDGGLIVVRAEIAQSAVRPVCVREADGSLTAFYRVADENIAATPLMVKAWQRASENDAVGGPVRLGDGERILLGLSARPEGVEVDEVMISAHLSRAATEDMVVRLYAMGLIDFTYLKGSFRLTACNDDE